MELTPLEQLSLVVDTLTGTPIWHVQVRAFTCEMFMRYDEGGMPLQPATRRGDWTIGLPEDVRAALRAIVAAKYEKRVGENARAVVRAWVDEQRKGPLADEARALRAKYLEKNPMGRFRGTG